MFLPLLDLLLLLHHDGVFDLDFGFLGLFLLFEPLDGLLGAFNLGFALEEFVVHLRRLGPFVGERLLYMLLLLLGGLNEGSQFGDEELLVVQLAGEGVLPQDVL
jgi:hypothetical protein